MAFILQLAVTGLLGVFLGIGIAVGQNFIRRRGMA